MRPEAMFKNHQDIFGGALSKSGVSLRYMQQFTMNVGIQQCR